MKKTLDEFCKENGREDLLAQWDAGANSPLTPAGITYGSGKKVWWRCEKGHAWQASVNSRSHGCGCPVCAGRAALPGENDLATAQPALAAQWHPTKNLPLTPAQVTQSSHQLVWWQCAKGHEWRAAVKSRAGGNGCPVCAGRRLLPGENDLATLSPALAAQWHTEKNGSLTPRQVRAFAVRRVWWRCPKGHEWQARIKDRMAGTGCPVCAGQKVVAGINDLQSSAPALVAQWHPTKNLPLTPQQVALSSNRRVWWQCSLGHTWQASVCARTRELTGCPYCTNRKVLAGFNDLATTDPEIARQWHPTLNGALTPEQVTTGSRKKVWWICPEGHVWKTVVYARTGPNHTGCPVCAGTVSQRRRQYETAAGWG